MFEKITHKLRPWVCVKSAVWERGELRCPCGEILALCYGFDGMVRVFIYPEFSKWKSFILEKKEEWHIGEDVIGVVCFDDFDHFMEEIRRTPLNTNVPEEEIPEEIIEEDTYIG